MSDACFLAPDVSVPVGGILRLDGPEGHHAARVRRIRGGESVLVTDGVGNAVRGIARSVGKADLTIEVCEQLRTPAPQLRFTAVQALPKGTRAELAVAALSELGVSEILAWQAARSVTRWDQKAPQALAKWRSIAAGATKQSRRFWIPTVSYVQTAEVCTRLAGATGALVLHEAADAPLEQVELPAQGEIVFVIGPEGGISPDELEQFRSAGAQAVTISDGVLRTATAGVVALAQLQLLARLRHGIAHELHF